MCFNFQKMNLSKILFWDVDQSQVNYDVNYHWVILRVFERGDVEDIRQIRRYYGDEKIREVLTNAKWLPLDKIYLACAILNNNLTDYRCYNLAQSNPQHWIY